MADRREFSVGGKPISTLRVVDLKVELEKRSLPKSGSKKDLLDRLRLVFNTLIYICFQLVGGVCVCVCVCCWSHPPQPLTLGQPPL